MKKIIAFLLIITTLFSLLGCQKKKGLKEKYENNEVINISIVQLLTAPPLDDARLGIIQALNDAGFIEKKNIKITLYNPENNTSSLKQMVTSAIKESDLIFAIATPVAQSLAKEAEKQGSNVPIIFTAVTDPVSSGIIDNSEKPGKKVTGTSDMNPVADQVDLFKALNASNKKLGFIYTSSESNSIIQLNLAKAKAKELDIELVIQAIASVNDLGTAVQSLINSGVDAIYLPTDNTISANASVVINETNLRHIPTICGEESFLTVGGTITLGINYKELGILTGQMAVEVIKGEKEIESMAVKTLTNFELIVNKTAAEANNISIPQTIISRADSIK